MSDKTMNFELLFVTLWQKTTPQPDMQTELPKDFVRLMHEHYDKATADALCLALTTSEPEASVS